jgi:2-iminobutanoate/2-iminopropanoate deaminase
MTGEATMRRQVITSCVLALVLASTVLAADKQIIRPPGAKPSGNWSYGVLVDGTLYVSGMAGTDADGKVAASFDAEVKQALDNIDAVLTAAGMTSADVVSVQVYLTDTALFQRMNKVYTGYFKDPRPARTTVVVAKLVDQGHVEITVTARK